MIRIPRGDARTPGLRPLLIILAAALLIRIGLVVISSTVGLQIVDEQHYATLARNVADGHGFAWGPNQPTSIRPPLYPLLVAGIWQVAAPGNLTAVRLVQIPLALLTIVLVYRLGVRLFSARTGLIAAGIVAIYPSLLFSGVLVLSEVLFTLLLTLTLLGCVTLLERPSLPLALGTGLVLGAAALTRSIMWPFLPVAMVGAFLLLRAPMRRRLAIAAVLAAGYLCVVAPWSARNTALQGTFTVVDTMGGLNLMMGNYEFTREDRMWDGVAIEGDRAWSAGMPVSAPDGGAWTEGTKEKWASAQAKAYILTHPLTFVRRAVLKAADFWGIERDYVAGVQQGLYSPPAWFFAVTALAVVAVYALVISSAVLGICLAPPARSAHVVLLSIVVFMCGLHAVVFGHPRYHLPLIPVLALYAAAAFDRSAWRNLSAKPWSAAAACTLVAALGVIWTRELLVRDADRLLALARMVVGS